MFRKAIYLDYLFPLTFKYSSILYKKMFFWKTVLVFYFIRNREQENRKAKGYFFIDKASIVCHIYRQKQSRDYKI